MSRFPARSFTAAQWTASTSIPLLGELCYERDTGKMKVGNGTSSYSSLPYFNTGGFSAGSSTPLINPVFTYSGDTLTRIDYDGGYYKTFTYSGDKLSQIDLVVGPLTIRKTFNYTGDVLTSITQTTLP